MKLTSSPSSGVNAHRMSLSWARIIPKGGKGDPINKEGVEFYRKVLTALLEAGIVGVEGVLGTARKADFTVHCRPLSW
jgi:beta-glucosidase/6-phospho-beta-glucosidase/beta-galactosidase